MPTIKRKAKQQKRKNFPRVDASRAIAERFVKDLLHLRHDAASNRRGFLKDAAAHEALKVASMLFEQLAGWARDHIVGRVLANIPSAPYAHGTQAERELGSSRPWDDPALEKCGARYDFDDPSANQRIIAELSSEVSYMLGYRLAFQLGEAFQALQLGETSDLVRPKKTYRKGAPYRLWLRRFDAVRQVEFLRGTGRQKYEAQDIVAEAYGLGDEISKAGRRTLEKWQQRLPDLLDPFVVRDGLFTARCYGEQYAALKKDGDLDELKAEHLAFLEKRFGTRALRVQGRSYRALQAC